MIWLLVINNEERAFAYGLNENLSYYRIVSNSNTSKKWESLKEVWGVYRRVEKLNLLYSTICFI